MARKVSNQTYDDYLKKLAKEIAPVTIDDYKYLGEPTPQIWQHYKAYIQKNLGGKITHKKLSNAINLAMELMLLGSHLGEMLHLASSLKDEAFLVKLLTKKQNLESCFKDRVTALMVACDNLNPKSSECLIRRGANVNAKDYEGRTPLHYAARNPNKEVAEVLLSNGADVNARDNVGRTPLMAAAASNSNAAVAELLLEKGADLYARDNQGWNALDHAKMMNCNPLIQDILIGRGLSHILDQEILDIFSAKHSIPFEQPSNADQAELDALADAILQDSLDWEAKQSN